MSVFDAEFDCFHTRVQTEIADIHEILDYLVNQPAPDAFAVLRLSAPASPDQVKTAFLAVEDLVRQRTRGSGLHNHALRQITKEARSILMEPEKQSAYQQWLIDRVQISRRETGIGPAQLAPERQETEGRVKRRRARMGVAGFFLAALSSAFVLISLGHRPALRVVPAPASATSATSAQLKTETAAQAQSADKGKLLLIAEQNAQASKRTIDDVQAKMVALMDQQDQKNLTPQQASAAREGIRTQCGQALRQANAAIELDKTNKTAWIARIAARYYMADYQNAQVDLKTAETLFPDSSDFKPLEALVNRGMRQSNVQPGA